jgi:hypothetical protein
MMNRKTGLMRPILAFAVPLALFGITEAADVVGTAPPGFGPDTAPPSDPSYTFLEVSTEGGIVGVSCSVSAQRVHEDHTGTTVFVDVQTVDGRRFDSVRLVDKLENPNPGWYVLIEG